LITLVLVAVLGAGFYMGWSMGANDAGNAVGPSVGSKMLTMRRAMLLMALFAILGAMLEGHYVTKTVGRGIVLFENENAAAVTGLAGATPTPFTFVPWAAFAAVFSAASWILIATYLGLPVSTSHSIVGGVIGAGFALMFLNPAALGAAGATVDFTRFIRIVISWGVAPIGAIMFAHLTFHAVSRPLRRIKNIALINRVYSVMTIITASYVAYAFGANDLGNAVGVVMAVNPNLDIMMLALFGGVAIACGAIMYSRKVIETIGKRITVLSPATAFAAQFGAALTVHIFTWLAIPVSTSHAAVGGVIGAGLVRGTSAVSGRKVGLISFAWVLTPLVVMGLSFAMSWALMGLS